MNESRASCRHDCRQASVALLSGRMRRALNESGLAAEGGSVPHMSSWLADHAVECSGFCPGAEPSERLGDSGASRNLLRKQVS